MNTKLIVGLTHGDNNSDHGVRSVTCQLELDVSLNEGDRNLDRLSDRICEAFDLCRNEIYRELNRPSDEGSMMESPKRATQNGSPTNQRGRTESKRQPASSTNGTVRRATEAQVRAIHAIAKRAGVKLASQLQSDFGVDTPSSLSIRQASDLIETLKGQLTPS